MHWLTAIEFARKCCDLSFEEWNNLYFDMKGPNEDQLRLCEETAYTVLVRNNLIAEGVVFVERPEVGRGVRDPH